METLRVLVTDDEPGMRLGVVRALRDYRVFLPDVGDEVGFTVEQSETGEDALERIRRQPPDILLLDHQMPGITGLEVLDHVAGMHLHMLTIMITAYASIETAVLATRRGADEFLPKPFTPGELRNALQRTAARLLLARRARLLAEEKRQVRFEFIRVLGHELKAPLSAVSGHLELVRSRRLGGDLAAYDEVLERCAIRIDGMGRLIHDLLDLTRIESGLKHRDLAMTDLREAVRLAIEAVQPLAQARGITIEPCEGEPMLLPADAGELEMICNNLLSNAVKYNRDGGRVSASLERDGSRLVLAVTDTGIGIEPESLARIFDEFVRIKNRDTALVEGTGLGLPIVRKLAQLYGGRVFARSEPGSGTTITVVLDGQAAVPAPAGDGVTAMAARPERSALVERELLHSLEWLISLRWIAGVGVLLVTPVAAAVFKMEPPVAKLAYTGLCILGYNVLLLAALRHMRRTDPDNVTAFERLARLQIALDWIAMAVLISLSGGAESPAILFFLFHIAIASLLLPHDLGLLYVSLAPLLVAGVAALEYSGVWQHVAIVRPTRFHDPLFVIASLGFFTVACYGMAYCCMAIALRLRRRETELASLYDGVRDITSTLEIDTVLDRIVEAAAHVLRCRAAAIRLIDPAGAQVEFAASFGLSETYRDEVPAEFARSRLDQDTLRDGVVHVLDVATDERVWQAARVREEGIASMLSAAIHGRTGAMGVLRAYGAPGHRFTDEDAAYLRTVAAQGAVAIEHAKAYRLLADLDRDKSRFLRMTTHELRSPVRVTESLLMTLADGYAGALGAEQGELVRRAQRRLASLHALIDDLLDLAAGKAKMVSPQRSVFDLRAIVAEVVERFEAVAAEKHVALCLQAPAGPFLVHCDPADADRIVANLVGNAVKYTLRGHVTVKLAEEAGQIRLEVADTGIGIPRESLPHLFQEFYRASNAKAVEESGNGLGLSIVKLLVDRAGGRITVSSREGEGSTFSLEMARAASADVADSPS